jgi:hypothetical protein
MQVDPQEAGRVKNPLGLGLQQYQGYFGLSLSMTFNEVVRIIRLVLMEVIQFSISS